MLASPSLKSTIVRILREPDLRSMVPWVAIAIAILSVFPMVALLQIAVWRRPHTDGMNQPRSSTQRILSAMCAVLAELCVYGANMWTIFQWARGGWRDRMWAMVLGLLTVWILLLQIYARPPPVHPLDTFLRVVHSSLLLGVALAVSGALRKLDPVVQRIPVVYTPLPGLLVLTILTALYGPWSRPWGPEDKRDFVDARLQPPKEEAEEGFAPFLPSFPVKQRPWRSRQVWDEGTCRLSAAIAVADAFSYARGFHGSPMYLMRCYLSKAGAMLPDEQCRMEQIDPLRLQHLCQVLVDHGVPSSDCVRMYTQRFPKTPRYRGEDTEKAVARSRAARDAFRWMSVPWLAMGAVAAALQFTLRRNAWSVRPWFQEGIPWVANVFAYGWLLVFLTGPLLYPGLQAPGEFQDVERGSYFRHCPRVCDDGDAMSLQRPESVRILRRDRTVLLQFGRTPVSTPVHETTSFVATLKEAVRSDRPLAVRFQVPESPLWLGLYSSVEAHDLWTHATESRLKQTYGVLVDVYDDTYAIVRGSKGTRRGWQEVPGYDLVPWTRIVEAARFE